MFQTEVYIPDSTDNIFHFKKKNLTLDLHLKYLIKCKTFWSSLILAIINDKQIWLACL